MSLIDKDLRPQQIRLRLTIFLLIVNLLVIYIMQVVGQSLKPYTIIQFEFAATVENANAMVSTWTKNGVMNQLFFLIGFDYLFMVTYSLLLWRMCLYVASHLDGHYSNAMKILGGLQFVAAGLDAVENVALYNLANDVQQPVWPVISYLCAVPKFIIVFLGLAGSVVGAITIKVWKRG